MPNALVIESDKLDSSTSVKINKWLIVKITIILTLIIVSVVILLWYNWATSYRYSGDKIGDKILAKYYDTPPETQYLDVVNGKLNNNNTAQATIQYKNKSDGKVVKEKNVSLNVLTNCSILNKSCIEL